LKPRILFPKYGGQGNCINVKIRVVLALKGHGFSRAANALEEFGASAPEGWF
jgi:hypothetical protein